MRLFERYNRVLLLSAFTGLAVMGWLFYGLLSYYLDRQMDDELLEELAEVNVYASRHNNFPPPNEFESLVFLYTPKAAAGSGMRYSDTTYVNHEDGQEQTGRMLTARVFKGSEPYEVRIIASKFRRVERIRNISLLVLLPVALLLVALFFVNRWMIRGLWAPFRRILANITSFNLNHAKPYESVASDTREFRELNDAILEMSEKVRSDFQDIKLFTENASHEMQTPLAVITSGLDTLLQSDRLGETETNTLADLYRASARLAKLNQSLLLLVKIGNNLLGEPEQIDLTALVRDRVSFFSELLNERRITLTEGLEPFSVVANRQLVEILINNLLTNAIRHNYYGGTVHIGLRGSVLTISNTGKAEPLQAGRIFERFYKGSDSDGTGLGLAILKQICARQDYRLVYAYTDNFHRFSVDFHPLTHR